MLFSQLFTVQMCLHVYAFLMASDHLGALSLLSGHGELQQTHPQIPWLTQSLLLLLAPSSSLSPFEDSFFSAHSFSKDYFVTIIQERVLRL